MDCRSPATIISRRMLHEIARNLRRTGKPLPEMSKLSIKVYGKDGKEVGMSLCVLPSLRLISKLMRREPVYL